MKKNTIMIMAAAFAASLALTGCADGTPSPVNTDGTFNIDFFPRVVKRECSPVEGLTVRALWNINKKKYLPADFDSQPSAANQRYEFTRIVSQFCLRGAFHKMAGRHSAYEEMMKGVTDHYTKKGTLNTPEAFTDWASVTAYDYGYQYAPRVLNR